MVNFRVQPIRICDVFFLNQKIRSISPDSVTVAPRGRQTLEMSGCSRSSGPVWWSECRRRRSNGNARTAGRRGPWRCALPSSRSESRPPTPSSPTTASPTVPSCTPTGSNAQWVHLKMILIHLKRKKNWLFSEASECIVMPMLDSGKGQVNFSHRPSFFRMWTRTRAVSRTRSRSGSSSWSGSSSRTGSWYWWRRPSPRRPRPKFCRAPPSSTGSRAISVARLRRGTLLRPQPWRQSR